MISLGRIVWLIILGLWVPTAMAIAGPRPEVTMADLQPAVVMLGVAGVATFGWGAVLGYRRSWKLLWFSALVGTGVLAAWYVVAMVGMAGPTDTTSDDAAGVGLVFFSIPLLVVVGSVLALGGLVGETVRRLRARFVRRSYTP